MKNSTITNKQTRDTRGALNVEDITYNNLPQAISLVIVDISEIKKMLSDRPPDKPHFSSINTKQLCQFLDLTEQTIITYRKKGVIPYYKIGSAIRYDMSKVLAALEMGNTKTVKK